MREQQKMIKIFTQFLKPMCKKQIFFSNNLQLFLRQMKLQMHFPKNICFHFQLICQMLVSQPFQMVKYKLSQSKIKFMLNLIHNFLRLMATILQTSQIHLKTIKRYLKFKLKQIVKDVLLYKIVLKSKMQLYKTQIQFKETTCKKAQLANKKQSAHFKMPTVLSSLKDQIIHYLYLKIIQAYIFMIQIKKFQQMPNLNRHLVIPLFYKHLIMIERRELQQFSMVQLMVFFNQQQYAQIQHKIQLLKNIILNMISLIMPKFHIK
ncbi:hypothetical protein TTHERM_001328951 (macronuclear) [Tetrahymena thermophila SB210]|uniref:Uncharacterized protein n=1 Tax=Tetrahymena thermophila (strain SB210) TaxID=312017 RepID=W7XBE1_TETTS|nr:hypothetical protein TTHERM_001328951 [Tetrahymena thermophila SB210]EWS74652.1 hypothetical protein TTHERM_001328951 [Tetrahymena thermophila SB210]|eukprot:XP_012652813.1 hypothetical protein TTHERM_001328951 [Tetrahymena thermophila SB210]